MLHLVKGALRRILFHPRGMNIASTAAVYRPYWIVNPNRIRIGEHSRVLRYGRLEAYDKHSAGELDGRIIIGDDVYIGCYCFIGAMGCIEIGDGCVLSDRVYVTDAEHGTHPDEGPIMRQPLWSKGPVKIGKCCFIGLGAAVLSGVTLGEHCVVGSNAVVTRSVPAYSAVAGNPARLIKVYDRERRQWCAPTLGR